MWVCEKREIIGLPICGKTGIADSKSSEILKFQFIVQFKTFPLGGKVPPLSQKSEIFDSSPRGGAKMDSALQIPIGRTG